MRRYLKVLGLVVLLPLIGSGIWLLLVFYEGEDPAILLNRGIEVVGQKTIFDITCTDEKSGIRSVSVTISQDGKRSIIESVNLAARGTRQKIIPIDLRPSDLKLHDGEARVDISVTDFSFRKNTHSLKINVVIDTIPPRISPMNAYHYINPGGSCVVVYSLSEVVPRTGVQVGTDFYTSCPEATTDGGKRYISYFAIPCDNVPAEKLKIQIFAEDTAGNTSFFALPFHVRGKTFRNDRMNISQRFLEMKMPEFQNRYKNLQGLTLVDAFSYVNKEMRAQNKEIIETICKETRPEKLWEGPFLRMSNTATMATFGDRRTYYHEKEIISKSIHKGVDLASTRNAPVEASNTGIVIFTGYIGIYGNTVIIDHGMGLCSLYAHLSSINTDKGQPVTKGEIIGRTGMTGMAGGDHLHFGMIVGGEFVNPVEWWDPHWIRDNVTRKLVDE